MKPGIRVTTLCLVIVIMALARTASEELHVERQIAGSIPTVDQILDKYLQAVGGKDAVIKLKTRMMKGSIVAPSGSAPLEIYQKLPNMFLVTIDSPAGGVSKNGYDGSVAWSQNNQRGLRELNGPEVENFKREYDLHREVRLKELYPRMTVKGREKIGDRETYVVEALATDGTAEAMYFDASNGLLIRRDVTIQGTTIQTYFEDYKQVDGIKVPFTIRRSRGDFSFTHKFDEVKHSLTIEDSRFNKPAAK